MKKLILFSSLIIAAGLTATNAQGTWTQKTDFGGMARWDAVAFSIGDKAYFGTGGIDPTMYKDFWEYDPSTDVWTQKADVGGSVRSYAVGLTIGNKGYVGMGWSGIGNSFEKDFWEYDPISNAWAKKADFPGGLRGGLVGFSIGSVGYLGTGESCCLGGAYTKDFWEYNPSTDLWTQKADFGGTVRANAVGFTINNKGYVGTGEGNSGCTKDFWEYDPVTNTWTQKADFGGVGRNIAAGFSIGSKGYIGCGHACYPLQKDFWEYDPANNTWKKIADFGGTARERATGFAVNGKGYVGTGYDGTNRKDFWEYTPEVVITCSTPTGLSALNITTTSAKLDWDDVSNVYGYGVRYKVAGETQWTSKVATVSSKKIEGLQPGTTYLWSVRSYCIVTPPALTSAWPPNQIFTTNPLRLESQVTNSLDVFPNPIQQSAMITYSVVEDSRVQIALYDISGKLMKALINENSSSGMHTFSLNSEELSQGIYLLKFQVNDELIVKKVVIE